MTVKQNCDFMPDEASTSKIISIRGVNSDVYDQFAVKVKELDMNIGDAITQMMNGVLSDFDDVFPHISSEKLRGLAPLAKSVVQHQRELKVTKRDLEEAGERFDFMHISNLTFAEDVDRETFEKYVHSVMHCGTVYVPKILPRLKMFSKIQHCKQIIFYPENEGSPSGSSSFSSTETATFSSEESEEDY